MNLLLPEDERESDEASDQPITVKHEPLHLTDSRTQPSHDVIEHKQAKEEEDGSAMNDD